MENAAKALIIAGGILIAIIILSLIVYMSTSMSRMMQAQEEKKSEQEIANFNKEYEAYNKELMYGIDIITVCNKASDYNEKNEISIDIKIYNKDDIEISLSYENEFKFKVFECVEVEHDSNTGRIAKMKFKEKDI